jgi:hypothetical protein
MKIAIRTFALTIVVSGFAAGAYSKSTIIPGSQVAPAAAPVPTCPLNSGGCGVW